MNECNIRFDRKKENNKIKRGMKERKNFVKKNLKKKGQKIKESPLDRLKCDQYS